MYYFFSRLETQGINKLTNQIKLRQKGNSLCYKGRYKITSLWFSIWFQHLAHVVGWTLSIEYPQATHHGKLNTDPTPVHTEVDIPGCVPVSRCAGSFLVIEGQGAGIYFFYHTFPTGFHNYVCLAHGQHTRTHLDVQLELIKLCSWVVVSAWGSP